MPWGLLLPKQRLPSRLAEPMAQYGHRHNATAMSNGSARVDFDPGSGGPDERLRPGRAPTLSRAAS